jgi:hypothetical protein
MAHKVLLLLRRVAWNEEHRRLVIIMSQSCAEFADWMSAHSLTPFLAGQKGLCAAFSPEREVNGQWLNPPWIIQGPRSLFHPSFELNLKPFGHCAALKEGEIVGDRRCDRQKTRSVMTHAHGPDAPVLKIHRP